MAAVALVPIRRPLPQAGDVVVQIPDDRSLEIQEICRRKIALIDQMLTTHALPAMQYVPVGREECTSFTACSCLVFVTAYSYIVMSLFRINGVWTIDVVDFRTFLAWMMTGLALPAFIAFLLGTRELEICLDRWRFSSSHTTHLRMLERLGTEFYERDLVRAAHADCPLDAVSLQWKKEALEHLVAHPEFVDFLKKLKAIEEHPSREYIRMIRTPSLLPVNFKVRHDPYMVNIADSHRVLSPLAWNKDDERRQINPHLIQLILEYIPLGD